MIFGLVNYENKGLLKAVNGGQVTEFAGFATKLLPIKLIINRLLIELRLQFLSFQCVYL